MNAAHVGFVFLFDLQPCGLDVLAEFLPRPGRWHLANSQPLLLQQGLERGEVRGLPMGQVLRIAVSGLGL